MRKGSALLLSGLILALPAQGSPAVPEPSEEAALARAIRLVESGDQAAAVGLLGGVGRSAPGGSARARADLLLGLLLAKLGRLEEAVAPLERAASSNPLLADYALAALAAARRQVGLRPEAAAALTQLVQNHPDSLLAERAYRELAKDLLALGDLSRAEEVARAALLRYPGSGHRPELLLTLAEALLQARREGEGEDLLRQLWLAHPASREAGVAGDLLKALPRARPFTVDERFARAAALYRSGHYAKAGPELSAFFGEEGLRGDQARLWAGIGAFHLRQYGSAIATLEVLAARAHAALPEVLFWLGRARGRSGDRDGFVRELERLVRVAPQGGRAPEALVYLGQGYAEEGKVAEAVAAFDRILKTYGASEWADDAAWNKAWLIYLGGDYRRAAREFQHLEATFPTSPFKIPALYWQARTEERLGNHKRAARLYREVLGGSLDDYYLERAEEGLLRLARPVARAASAPGKGSAPSPPVPREGLHLLKARELRALALADEAAEEYWELARVQPDDRGLLAEACRALADLQRYEGAVWIGKRVLRPLWAVDPRRLPIPGFWDCLFPLGYWEVVRGEAASRGLDPLLVEAVIREESAFAPRAISPAGARGLMQMMPPTAEKMSHSLKLAPLPPDGLDAPATNILLGTQHLADLLAEFGGDPTLGLAAYNGGAHNVRRWVKERGHNGAEEFVESIPFAETRLYVKRVLGSYRRYRLLYGAQASGPLPARPSAVARETR